MNWRRIGGIALALALVSLVVVALPIANHTLQRWQAEAAETPHPKAVSDAEWRAMLPVLLESPNFEGAPPPPKPGEVPQGRKQRSIVLISTSATLCEEKDPALPAASLCPDNPSPRSGITSPYVDARIPLKLRRELVAVNNAAIAVPLPESPHFIPVAEKEILALLSADGGWRGFYANHPGTVGLMHVSRPVLSEDGSSALIYAENHCGVLCGEGGIYLLERAKAGWSIVLYSELWVS